MSLECHEWFLRGKMFFFSLPPLDRSGHPTLSSVRRAALLTPGSHQVPESSEGLGRVPS